MLQALTAPEPVVLLLDEVDKTSEELEYALLEVLDEFSMTIPQYGTIRCPEERRPMIFLTSNRYRELSDALKRRCNYLYIPSKKQAEIARIVLRQTELSEEAAKAVAKCLAALQGAKLLQTPSIAEGLAWVAYIAAHPELMAEDAEDLAFLLAKNARDTESIRRVLKENSSAVERIREDTQEALLRKTGGFSQISLIGGEGAVEPSEASEGGEAASPEELERMADLWQGRDLLEEEEEE